MTGVIESKSVQLIRDFFVQIGIENYHIFDIEEDAHDGQEKQDIIYISTPSKFNPGLKRLLGKGNRNLTAFKTFLKVYGSGEGRNNFIVLKLTHEKKEVER